MFFCNLYFAVYVFNVKNYKIKEFSKFLIVIYKENSNLNKI